MVCHESCTSECSWLTGTPGVDDDSCYEIRPAPGKGLGVFATKFIPAGTLILSENALFIIKKPSDFITEQDVVLGYNKLSADEKRIFDQMRDSKAEAGLNPFNFKSGRFHANKFAVNHERTSFGCFPVSSRFNHSCLPNTVGSGDDIKQHQQCRAINNIQPGEELTTYYFEECQFMTTEERTKEMPMTGHVQKCVCELCSRPAGARLVSDMRRFLLRQLIYMVHGCDLRSVTSTMTAKAIENANWRRENLKEVGATLHMFLIGKLCDAEGVVGGNIPFSVYGSAAHLVIRRARQLGLCRLTKPALENVRVWTKRSKDLLTLFCGRDGNEESPYGDLLRLVNDLPDDGRLPEE